MTNVVYAKYHLSFYKTFRIITERYIWLVLFMLGVTNNERHSVTSHYAECRYADCCYARETFFRILVDFGPILKRILRCKHPFPEEECSDEKKEGMNKMKALKL
jgi:hypothetical protein